MAELFLKTAKCFAEIVIVKKTISISQVPPAKPAVLDYALQAHGAGGATRTLKD